jgi:hypothetical protein
LTLQGFVHADTKSCLCHDQHLLHPLLYSKKSQMEPFRTQ